MIGKTTGPGAFVSRASVRGGWVKDQHDHRRPAHNRRPGRDLQFKTGNKSVIIAARGACFLEDVGYPKLSTLETFLWPMLDPLEIPEVVPVATSPPGTAHGSSGNAMSDAPAESGQASALLATSPEGLSRCTTLGCSVTGWRRSASPWSRRR